MKRYTGPPATLGSTAAAQVRVIVWCKACQHQVEPDPAEHAARYGAELPVRDWVKRFKCSQCGSRSVDFVLTGARRQRGRRQYPPTPALDDPEQPPGEPGHRRDHQGHRDDQHRHG